MGPTKTTFRALAGRVTRVLGRSRGVRYFQIELSSRHRWYVAPARLVLAMATGVLGVLIVWSATQTVMMVSDRYNLQAGLDHIRTQDRQFLAEAQQEGIDLSEASLQQLPGEVSLANQLLAKRNFSWTQFLSVLEAAIPPHLSIKNIRPDPVSAVVHITGLAVAVEDVTALMVTLQGHAVFRDPVLGQHRVGPDGLVEFDLTLRYRQPGV
ncbi:MAG: hypothetical protein A2V62_04490 [Nitrospirae bacterium RBG_19FT_COMBO_58_9]|nr:MAG: hypothetical protein A2V62_04490 [Nitrospirae bacterium RBG_19FT_COMBO_58_9]